MVNNSIKKNSLLDKYYKFYNKHYKNDIYKYSYYDMINHFIKFNIYNNDASNIDNINNKFEKIILQIKDKNLKVKLIPLIIFLGEEYWNNLIDKNYFCNINSILLHKFIVISLKINFKQINKKSSNYEFLKKMLTNIENLSFQTIVNFEPYSYDMCYHQYNNFIYLIAKKYFFVKYCKALDKKDKFSFLSLTHNLKYEYKKDILKNIHNKTLLQIVLFEHICNDNNNSDITDMVYNFSSNQITWENFLNYYMINQYEHTDVVCKSICKVLNQHSNDYIIDSFIKNIKIDKFINEKIKNRLNSIIFNIENKNTKKYIMKEIFTKWNNFIDTYEDDIIHLLLTNTEDIVILYIRNYLSKDVVEKNIKKLKFNIEEIDNHWHKNNSAKMNYLYKQRSKLSIFEKSLKSVDS